jgi:tetratricopeptide (TPR) repeat protein
MFGLFGKDSKDPELKEIRIKKKELRKLVKEKKYDYALKSSLKLLNKVPHENDVLFIVGSIYYMKNNYHTAISYLDKSLEIAEYDTEALLLKALSHFQLQQLKKAKNACDKILEIDPKNKAVADLLLKINHTNNS